MSKRKGRVYLVGAGPGDPKLITIRALEALKKADAVVYDRLASPRLLHHVKPDADKIFVGKLPDKHMLRQEEINQLLVDLAMEGKTVVRLKGGDPCVFGRVGEEAELLADNGVDFEIVPGVTSAIGVPAYAGIPVTHRDYTSSFTIVTGHEYPNKTYSDVDYAKLASATGTIIFLMGVANIRNICEQLLMCGKSKDLPVALIRWGTWMEQQTLVGTLEDIADKVQASGFQSPAIIIVGEVVRLREKLAWFEKKPLFGKRILVTRARSQSSGIAEQIDELGGEALEFPIIRIEPPSDRNSLQALDEALHQLRVYDWIVFTSPNGVEFFFRRLRELKIDVRALHAAKLATVGPKTAEALLDRGLLAESIPDEFQAESLLTTMLQQMQPGARVLLPRADIARETLPSALRQHGMLVTEIDVYKTVLTDEYGESLLQALRSHSVHIVTFTSSSTVRNLFEILQRMGVEAPLQLLEGVKVACIGPVTAATAVEYGLNIDILANEATVESLVDALVNHHASPDSTSI